MSQLTLPGPLSPAPRQYFFYEAADMLRKLLLAAVLLFAFTGAPTQLLIALLVEVTVSDGHNVI